MTSSAQVKGTCLLVGAAMVFAVVALVVQKDPLPLTLAAQARFSVCWFMSVAFMLRYRTERNLQWFGPAPLRKLLFLRSVLFSGFVTLWWAALREAPLGDCIALIYCSPLLTALLSRAILGEELPAVLPLQAALAMSGMVLIVHPPVMGSLFWQAPNVTMRANYTLVICSMCASAVLPILTRKTKTCSWIEVEHCSSAVSVFMLNPLIFCAKQLAKPEPLSLPAVDPGEVGLIVLAALGSFLGLAMQTAGFQMAEPGKAVMFTYLEVPFAYFLQHVGTGSPIPHNSCIGATLILLACLLGVAAEGKKHAEAMERQLSEQSDGLLSEQSDGLLSES